MNLMPYGAVAKLLRNIGENGQFPYAYAGDEVRIVGHCTVGTVNGNETLYKIDNGRGLVILANPEDLTQDMTRLAYPPEVEKLIQDAFREGYSRGHSRGTSTMKFYGGDDQYSIVIQVETNSYVRELKGETDDSDV